MKLSIDKKLANNNYEVTISIAEVLPEETELFNDFGNLTVNVGGVFTETVETVETTILTLGDSFKKVPTDFPLTKIFTQAQYGANAEKVANVYAEATSAKIQTAITALKAKQDGFTGTTEIIL